MGRESGQKSPVGETGVGAKAWIWNLRKRKGSLRASLPEGRAENGARDRVGSWGETGGDSKDMNEDGKKKKRST